MLQKTIRLVPVNYVEKALLNGNSEDNSLADLNDTYANTKEFLHQNFVFSLYDVATYGALMVNKQLLTVVQFKNKETVILTLNYNDFDTTYTLFYESEELLRIRSKGFTLDENNNLVEVVKKKKKKKKK